MITDQAYNKEGIFNQTQYPSNMEKKTHGLPALLSFFLPGFGQLIKGHVIKAICIWIIGGIVSFLLFWTIIVPFSIWAWNVYDAYNSN